MTDPRPPDRGAVPTEGRHPDSRRLHELTVAGCIDLLVGEELQAVQAVRAAAPAATAFVAALVPRFAAGGRLVTLGAGTSGRLAVLDAAEVPPTFDLEEGRIIGVIAGGERALRHAVEGAEDDPRGAEPALAALALGERDAVLGITAGGTTPYELGALRYARTRPGPPLTALLTCGIVPEPAAAEHVLHVATGPEVLCGSTRLKAGTATKLVLNAISTTLMVQTGRVHDGLMVDLRATNAKLRDRAARIVTALCDVPREEAFALLEAAGGEVKTAVVMQWRGLDPPGARTRLTHANGRLDQV